MAALCIGVGALSGPLAYLLARQVLEEPRARVAALLLALAPGALLYGATSADALFMTLGLLAAWPLAARGWRRARGRRCRARGRVVLRVVAARGRRLGGDRRLAPRRPAHRGRAVRALRCRAAGVLRPAVRRERLRPDRHDPRDRGGLPRRHRLAAAVLVLAARLADRVPARARAPARLPRAEGAGAARDAGVRDLRGDRDRGRARAHQGRDRADLALPRPVRLPRAAATQAKPTRWLFGALAAQALLYELLFDTVW